MYIELFSRRRQASSETVICKQHWGPQRSSWMEGWWTPSVMISTPFLMNLLADSDTSYQWTPSTPIKYQSFVPGSEFLSICCFTWETEFLSSQALFQTIQVSFSWISILFFAPRIYLSTNIFKHSRGTGRCKTLNQTTQVDQIRLLCDSRFWRRIKRLRRF